MRPPVVVCPSAWRFTIDVPLKSPAAPAACAPACARTETASAVISPWKIEIVATSADARPTAFVFPIVVVAAAVVAPVVTIDPSAGYAKLAPYAGDPFGGAVTDADPPPLVIRMAHAVADALGSSAGPTAAAPPTTAATATRPRSGKRRRDTPPNYGESRRHLLPST